MRLGPRAPSTSKQQKCPRHAPSPGRLATGEPPSSRLNRMINCGSNPWSTAMAIPLQGCGIARRARGPDRKHTDSSSRQGQRPAGSLAVSRRAGRPCGQRTWSKWFSGYFGGSATKVSAPRRRHVFSSAPGENVSFGPIWPDGSGPYWTRVDSDPRSGRRSSGVTD